MSRFREVFRKEIDAMSWLDTLRFWLVVRLTRSKPVRFMVYRAVLFDKAMGAPMPDWPAKKRPAKLRNGGYCADRDVDPERVRLPRGSE